MKLRNKHREIKSLSTAEIVTNREKAEDTADPLTEYSNLTWDTVLANLYELRASSYARKEYMNLLLDLAVLYPDKRGELELDVELLNELLRKYNEALERGDIENCLNRAYEIVILFPEQRCNLRLDEATIQDGISTLRLNSHNKGNENPSMPYVRIRTLFPGRYEGSKVEQAVWSRALEFINKKKGKSTALLLKAAATFRLAFPESRHAMELDDQTLREIRDYLMAAENYDEYNVQANVRQVMYAAILFAEKMESTTEGPRIVRGSLLGRIPDLPQRNLAA